MSGFCSTGADKSQTERKKSTALLSMSNVEEGIDDTSTLMPKRASSSHPQPPTMAQK